MCAIKHLSSLTAKNRPGLPKKSVLLFDRYAPKHSPCMPAMTKEKMFKAGCDQLVLQRFPCASRRKLSSLRILKIETFVQPCSLTIDSTSSRRGCMHCGLVYTVSSLHGFQSVTHWASNWNRATVKDCSRMLKESRV